MGKPKAFISYCSADRILAMQIKHQFSEAGCDSWQFDLSAVPGTDAWNSILKQVEDSDFFVVLLSQGAVSSPGVLEEIAHAHYSSLNSGDNKPRIIPVVLDSSVTVPRQIVRAVRLPFDQNEFDQSFDLLSRAMGLESSPFRNAMDLEITTVTNREIDLVREADRFVSGLISFQPVISKQFEEMIREWKDFAGGRFRQSTQTLEWHQDRQREEFEDGDRGRKITTELLVFVALNSGISSGSWTTIQVVVRVTATEILRFKQIDEQMELESNTVTLKFAKIGHVDEENFQLFTTPLQTTSGFLDSH